MNRRQTLGLYLALLCLAVVMAAVVNMVAFIPIGAMIAGGVPKARFTGLWMPYLLVVVYTTVLLARGGGQPPLPVFGRIGVYFLGANITTGTLFLKVFGTSNFF